MVRPSSNRNTASGKPQQMRRQSRRDRRRCDRLDALGLHGCKPFRHLVREQRAPRPLRKLLPQRQVRQRIQRIVEIEQQLAPLHADDVVGRPHRQMRDRKLRRGPRLVLFDDDIAGSRAMKSPLAQSDHIEGDHAGEHPPPRQSLAQHGNVADAILQADNHRLGRSVLCDQACDVGRIGAFYRHQHRAGVLENRRIVRKRKLAGFECSIETLEARYPQTVAVDFLDHARSRQQRHAAARIGKNASDKATDAAGAGHDDGLGPIMLASHEVFQIR